MTTKTAYSEKLLDPRWQKIRLKVLEREEFKCQYCGETKKTLHVHHLCYSESGNPWDVDDCSLLCLCCDCHSVDHAKKLTDLEKELIEHIQFWGQTYNGTDMITNLFIRNINKTILKHKG